MLLWLQHLVEDGFGLCMLKNIPPLYVQNHRNTLTYKTRENIVFWKN